MMLLLTLSFVKVLCVLCHFSSSQQKKATFNTQKKRVWALVVSTWKKGPADSLRQTAAKSSNKTFVLNKNAD